MLTLLSQLLVKNKQKQKASKYRECFLQFIKSVENAQRIGRLPNGTWLPHASPEGGADTIGYGHKLKKGDDFSLGLTDAEVDELLIEDLEKADDILKAYLKEEYFALDVARKEMLLDFVFNLGSLRGFPKFTQAVIKGDQVTMEAEYKRFYKTPKGVVHELKRRNRLFHLRYLV